MLGFLISQSLHIFVFSHFLSYLSYINCAHSEKKANLILSKAF